MIIIDEHLMDTFVSFREIVDLEASFELSLGLLCFRSMMTNKSWQEFVLLSQKEETTFNTLEEYSKNALKQRDAYKNENLDFLIPSFKTLAQLKNKNINVTATDLCNYMRMQKSQMNRTLTSMEKKGLITRIRSEQDTRKIYITLNDSMIRIYKKQHEKILKIVDELFDKIGYEKQPEVIELFDLITQTAKEML